MKSEIAAAEPKSEYPCLKQFDNGEIVLFTRPKTGISIVESQWNEIGYTNDAWKEDEAILFTGKVILSN